MDGYECLDNIVPMNTEKSMPKIKFTNEDTAVIIYSSGTTGLPKGVIHTHYALIANTVCITYVPIFVPSFATNDATILLARERERERERANQEEDKPEDLDNQG